MALIGWILSFVGFFGGLALRQDMPVGGSAMLSNLLMVVAFLACPVIWRTGPLGLSRRRRIVATLIVIFCAPLILLPGA